MVFNIVVSYTVVSEECKKETETEESIGFFVTFLSLVKFQLGRGRTPCPPPLGDAYAPSEENQKVLANFLRSFWRFPTKFNCSKSSAVQASNLIRLQYISTQQLAKIALQCHNIVKGKASIVLWYCNLYFMSQMNIAKAKASGPRHIFSSRSFQHSPDILA